jgi:integrase/recombinase XerD
VAWSTARGIDRIEDVTDVDVSNFAVSLRREGDPSPQQEGDPLPLLGPASAARVVVAVRTFHRFAAREGLTDSDPARHVRPSAIPKRLPKALSYDEVSALIEGAGDLETPEGLRDRALVEFLYGTGTRVSEATGLDVDDVDLGDLTVIVTGKGDKQRILPLGQFAADALGAYLIRARPALVARGRGTSRLFLNSLGRPLSRQSAYGILQQAAERAGITSQVSPHSLRHSFATHLLQNGADVRVVQELLGHASVTTTQIYTLVTVDHLREVYADSHPRAR